MKRISITPRVYTVCAVCLSLLGLILRTVCVLTQFDNTVGYFDKGWLSLASRILYFVAVACFAVGAIVLPKGSVASGLTSRAHTLAAYLLALTLVGFSVGAVIFWTANRAITALLPMAGATAVSALYFFLTASCGERVTDRLAVLGFVPVLWSILAVGETYVDPYTTINSPLKLALQMGFLGFMLLTISELRFRLGKPSPRRSIFLCAVAAFTCLTASVSTLVGFIGSVKMNSLYPLYAAVLLAAGIYALLSFPRTAPAPIAQDTHNKDVTENPEASEEV